MRPTVTRVLPRGCCAARRSPIAADSWHAVPLPPSPPIRQCARRPLRPRRWHASPPQQPPLASHCTMPRPRARRRRTMPPTTRAVCGSPLPPPRFAFAGTAPGASGRLCGCIQRCDSVQFDSAGRSGSVWPRRSGNRNRHLYGGSAVRLSMDSEGFILSHLVLTNGFIPNSIHFIGFAMEGAKKADYSATHHPLARGFCRDACTAILRGREVVAALT